MLERMHGVNAGWRGAGEVAFAFPVLFPIAVYAVPNSVLPLWFVLLAVCYAAGFAYARLWPSSHRYVRTAAAIVTAVIPFILTVGAGSAGTWIGAACGFILFFRGQRALHAPWSVTFPIQSMWLAAALYLPAAVIFRIAERLRPYADGMLWMGLLALAIVIFAANEARLERATAAVQGGSRVPSALRSINRAWTLLLVSLIFLIGSFGMLRSLLARLLGKLTDSISRLFASGSDTYTETNLDQSPDGMQQPLEADVQHDPVWMQWAVKAVFVLAVIAFVVFLGFVLYRFGGRLRAIVQAVMRWLRRGDAALGGADGGYEDEKESLLDLKELRRGVSDRMQSLLDRLGRSGPAWSDLRDNREKIRFLYRTFVKRGMSRGYAFKPHFTPLETGEDLAAWERGDDGRLLGRLGRLYSQARYADDRSPFETDELDTLYRASQKT